MTNSLLIQGDNVHMYKYVDAAPFEIVCNATLELIKEVELIGATTPDSGDTPEIRPRLKRVSATITGASTSTNDGDISIFYLEERITEAHDIEIVFTDNGGTQRTHRQDFYIERLIHNANAGEPATYDLSLRGTGPYTESTLTDPEVTGNSIESQSYTVAGGVIQDNDWIGLASGNIIGVYREGSEQLSLGLPYTFNSGTGTITPDPSTTIDGQRMFVIWTF